MWRRWRRRKRMEGFDGQVGFEVSEFVVVAVAAVVGID